jgi:hypothetical protein
VSKRGLAVIATGGPDQDECCYLDEIWSNDAPFRRLDGQLTWPQLAVLLAKARVYVGLDYRSPIGMKVSDEFTVPLCRGHHRQLHQAGNEVVWWAKYKVEPLQIAQALWEQTHPSSVGKETPQSSATAAEAKAENS